VVEVTYTNAQAREQLLDSLASAADQIGSALASLGEAYELLDEDSAERLEEELFGPVQLAYGRLKRTYADFAKRYELPSRTFTSRPPGAPSNRAKGFIESAADDVSIAEQALATLQDSMLPIEVGDAQLRAGISQTRELLGGMRGRTRELLRTFGR
jgi:hypothetical protein